MSEDSESGGMRARGEEALSEFAHALLDSPLFNNAVARALGAGERAATAQRQALTALNVASSADLERLEQRLRSLSGRLEAAEDALDDLRDELAALRRSQPASGPAHARDDDGA